MTSAQYVCRSCGLVAWSAYVLRWNVEEIVCQPCFEWAYPFWTVYASQPWRILIHLYTISGKKVIWV